MGRHVVRRMGFGAMQLPGPGVFGPPKDHDAALQVVRHAVELGMDHIDTAQFYGPDCGQRHPPEAPHPYPRAWPSCPRSVRPGTTPVTGSRRRRPSSSGTGSKPTWTPSTWTRSQWYNLVDIPDSEVFEACRDDGVAFVPFFPLGSAFHADNPVLADPIVVATARRWK